MPEGEKEIKINIQSSRDDIIQINNSNIDANGTIVISKIFVHDPSLHTRW